MAYMTISISSKAVKSVYGDSQAPIKQFLEARGEAFEQESVLKKLFRMNTSENFAEKFTGLTAMDGFMPVGEGGDYPKDGFQEGYDKLLEHMTWKDSYSITRELAEDHKLGKMKEKAGAFITGYNRTREKFGRALYGGAISGTSVNFRGKKFSTCGADGKSLFATDHPSKVKGAAQTNKYTNAFSAAALGKIATEMQNTKGDNGEVLDISPDTIVIPNQYALKEDVFAAIGSTQVPGSGNNDFNFQFGIWNVIVDPYLNEFITAGTSPFILLDSKYIESYGGPEWLDRTKLDVKSSIDSNNDNNIWTGFARFIAGFSDWRFAAVGGAAGGTTLS